jgi:hypothetical protein
MAVSGLHDGREELDLWVMENTLKSAVFLGSTWHSNPAMSIGEG